MQKIKFVISDLHLGNGRFLPDGSVNPLEDFVYDNKFIEFIDYCGSNEDADVELIINGDFLNMIQLMPEEQKDGILTERSSVNKTEAIIRGHRGMFDAMKNFNAHLHRRIVFTLGNHDPGLLWIGVQDTIRRVIQGEISFINEAYLFDGVHVEHGNRLEPIFRFDRKRYFLTRGYPEPVLNLPWGVFFVKDFLYHMKQSRPYIDKVKPYNMYSRWAIFNDFWFGLFHAVRYIVFIIKTRFSSLPLKRAGALKGLSAFIDLKRSPTMAEDARKILDEEDASIVILGHTHIPIHKSFGHEREYLNPGCWNDVTALDLNSLGHACRLIFVRIDYKQDKPFARLLEWHGQHHVFEEVRA
ncbi:MAG TPA: metallophosphoesterase [Myxococcota bacterium]|nr:metallophosphoesterase [Myxococcota bacterium]